MPCVQMVIGMAGERRKTVTITCSLSLCWLAKLMMDDFPKQLLAIDESATLLNYLSEQPNLGLN